MAWSCWEKTQQNESGDIYLSVPPPACLHTCRSTYLPVHLTGVSIWTLSVKLPMKVMIDIRWLSLSMRLNCIMKRSSSLRASRGFLSLSYCRSSFTSASVGRKRIRHSTKSTRTVRRSNLQTHHKVWSGDLGLLKLRRKLSVQTFCHMDSPGSQSAAWKNLMLSHPATLFSWLFSLVPVLFWNVFSLCIVTLISCVWPTLLITSYVLLVPCFTYLWLVCY